MLTRVFVPDWQIDKYLMAGWRVVYRTPPTAAPIARPGGAVMERR